MDFTWQIDLLRRQYLQLVEPDQLVLPPMETLRFNEVQKQICYRMFNESGASFLPPSRYRFRVLKRIINAIEQSITDPEEDVGFSPASVF